jgi:arsenate reductase-like glutaredoxin family protein
MVKLVKKIGWQKYEDYIEKQLSCPMLQNILQSMFPTAEDLIEDNSDDSEDEDESYADEDEDKKSSLAMVIHKMLPLTPQIIDDISVLANFDCWIGHANFDITPKIRDQLNKIAGVEVLKIFSRYRFFVGIGQMFDFQNVRYDIEKIIIKGEIDD